MREQDQGQEEPSIRPGTLWLLTPIAKEQGDEDDDNAGCGCSLRGLALLLVAVAFLVMLRHSLAMLRIFGG